MKKFSIMICLVSALLLGMASCGDSQQKRLRLSKQEKARLDSIDRASLKVGVMPTLDCLPVYLAYEDSIFLKQGVTVHLYRYNAQMDCDTAIARKRVEGTVTDLVRAARLQKQGTQLFYQSVLAAYHQPQGAYLGAEAVVRQDDSHDPSFCHRLSLYACHRQREDQV